MTDNVIVLDKLDPTTKFEIWAPRYHDDIVLLHAQRVKNSTSPHIKVVFTKTNAPKYEGEFYLSKRQTMSYKKEKVGNVYMYAVPFEDLCPLVVKATGKYIW